MTTEVTITGFDSAWGGKQWGAICDMRLLPGGDLEISGGPDHDAWHVRWDEAVTRVAQYSPDDVHVVSIDQPLVVANATGHRPVDRRLASALMKTYGCGAHAANTGNTMFGADAGIWRFLDALDEAGYRHAPDAIARRTPGRFYVECYPNLALIGLLNRFPRYKVRHGDGEAWRQLIEAVHALARPAITNIADHLPLDLEPTKAREDELDAIIAAYVGARLWLGGWDAAVGCRFVGALDTGYMVTPCCERLGACLDPIFGPRAAPSGAAERARPAAVRTSVADASSSPRARADSGVVIEEGAADLVCTDPGNLWANANPWLTRFDVELEVTLLDDEEERTLLFVPFGRGHATLAQRATQRGLKISNGDFDRALWAELTGSAGEDACSKTSPHTYRVSYRFVRRRHD